MSHFWGHKEHSHYLIHPDLVINNILFFLAIFTVTYTDMKGFSILIIAGLAVFSTVGVVIQTRRPSGRPKGDGGMELSEAKAVLRPPGGDRDGARSAMSVGREPRG